MVGYAANAVACAPVEKTVREWTRESAEIGGHCQPMIRIFLVSRVILPTRAVEINSERTTLPGPQGGDSSVDWRKDV